MGKYSWIFPHYLTLPIFESTYINSIYCSKFSTTFFSLWLSFTSYTLNDIGSGSPSMILSDTHGSYGLNLKPSVSNYFPYEYIIIELILTYHRLLQGPRYISTSLLFHKPHWENVFLIHMYQHIYQYSLYFHYDFSSPGFLSIGVWMNKLVISIVSTSLSFL